MDALSWKLVSQFRSFWKWDRFKIFLEIQSFVSLPLQTFQQQWSQSDLHLALESDHNRITCGSVTLRSHEFIVIICEGMESLTCGSLTEARWILTIWMFNVVDRSNDDVWIPGMRPWHRLSDAGHIVCRRWSACLSRNDSNFTPIRVRIEMWRESTTDVHQNTVFILLKKWRREDVSPKGHTATGPIIASHLRQVCYVGGHQERWIDDRLIHLHVQINQRDVLLRRHCRNEWVGRQWWWIGWWFLGFRLLLKIKVDYWLRNFTCVSRQSLPRISSRTPNGDERAVCWWREGNSRSESVRIRCNDRKCLEVSNANKRMLMARPWMLTKTRSMKQNDYRQSYSHQIKNQKSTQTKIERKTTSPAMMGKCR